MPECILKELVIYFFPVDSFAAAAKRFSKVVKKYIGGKKKTVEKYLFPLKKFWLLQFGILLSHWEHLF